MRMIMEVRIPVEPFNTAVRNGTAGKTMQEILGAIKPEHAFFCEHNGRRGGILIIDMKDASEIPMYAEPWFLKFNAEVEFKVAMTPEDLGRANLDALGKKWA
jgi:hypothetical protein